VWVDEREERGGDGGGDGCGLLFVGKSKMGKLINDKIYIIYNINNNNLNYLPC
jgi:hypothetical protein